MPSWGEPRSKTISWHDPAVTVAALPALSGLELLQQMADGLLPPAPISSHFGTTVLSVSFGDVVFGCTPDESAYNPIGMVHGGLVCTLLDSVTACAVHSTLPAGTAYTSLEIKVSYLRKITIETGPLTAHGWVTKPGRRAAFAEGDVRDAEGKVLATATSTCLVMGP